MVFSEQADLNIPLMLAKKRKLCLNIYYIGILCAVCRRDPSNHWMVQSQAEACKDTVTEMGVCVFRRVRKIAKSD